MFKGAWCEMSAQGVREYQQCTRQLSLMTAFLLQYWKIAIKEVVSLADVFQMGKYQTP